MNGAQKPSMSKLETSQELIESEIKHCHKTSDR